MRIFVRYRTDTRDRRCKMYLHRPRKLVLLSTGKTSVPIGKHSKKVVFDPDTTKVLGIVFERARQSLKLADRTDLATELVAKKIIDLARNGERDPDQLYQLVLKEFDGKT
jgi:outer membrane lipoprotein-sorting protein